MPFCNGCGDRSVEIICPACVSTFEQIGLWLSSLELEPGASQAEIKQAFRDLAKIWHPDRFAGDARVRARAQDKFVEINNAYHSLEENRQMVVLFENLIRRGVVIV